MIYEVIVLVDFRRTAKKIVRKHPKFKTDLARIVKSLKSDPTQGTAIGENRYKIRVAISGSGRGKSSGVRVYTYVVVRDAVVYLVAMHTKAERATLKDQEINTILRKAGLD